MERKVWLLCLLVFLLPVLFWPGLYNPYAPLKFALLLCAAPTAFCGVVWAAFGGGRDWFRSRSLLHVALAVEGIAFLLGTVFSVHPSLSFWGSHERRMGFATFLVCGATALLASRAICSPERLKRLVRYLLWGCVASSLISVFLLYCERTVEAIQEIASLDLPRLAQAASFLRTERLDGTLGNPNFFANYLLFPSLCAVGWLWTQRSLEDRALGAASLLLGLWCLELSHTRGAQMGFLAGVLLLAAFVCFSRKGTFNAKSMSILGVLAAGVGAMLLLTFLRRTDSSGSGRLLLWRDALPLLQDVWLIGTGVEGFRAGFMPFRSMELAQFAPDANWRTAHNVVLDTWITMGIAGLAGYALLVAAAARGWWLAVRRAASIDRESLPLVAACFAALAAYLVHNLFNCDVLTTFFLFHLFVGMGWGLSQPLPEKTSSQTRGQETALLWGRIAVWMLTGCAAFFAIGSILADRAAFLSLQQSGPNGNTDRMIRNGRKALQLSPWKDEYHYTFARALDRGTFHCDEERKERVLDLALEHARIAAQTPSSRPEARLITLASLTFRSGRLDEAMEIVNQALKIDPYFWGTHRLKTLILLAQGNRLEEAMASAQKAVQLKPGDPNVHNVYERVWDAMTPFDALKEYEEGNRFLDQDQLEAAEDSYRAAIEKAGTRHPKAWNNLGYVLELQGKLAEAEEAYRKALDLTEGYQAEANTGLSSVLIRRGAVDEAIPHLRKASEIKPLWAKPWKHLLVAFARKKERKDALRSLNEYLAREEDTEQRKTAQLYFERHFP